MPPSDPERRGDVPRGWTLMREADDGFACRRDSDGLQVICSEAEELDGNRWVHVSCSRRGRIPSWDDLTAVKNLFIGIERRAYQVVAERSKHINIHPYCLHLFAPANAEDDPMPDFARGGNSI